MSTTVSQISQWFDEALDEGGTHMLVVTDTFSGETFPVTVYPEDDPEYVAATFNREDRMTRVEELYDLKADKAEQMTPYTKVWRP